MKLHCQNSKLSLYFLSLFITSLLVACGTAQNVSNNNDDGIYDDTAFETRRKNANVTHQKPYNDNYFTKELERLDQINGTDIITDIESYKSDDDNEDFEEITENDHAPKTRITYNEPWGFDNDTDVVININTGFGYSNYYSPFYDLGYYRHYNSLFWDPYPSSYYWNTGFYGDFAFNNPFYCPPYYNRAYYRYHTPYRYYGNRYYSSRRGINRYYQRPYHITSRRSYARNSRRGSAINSRRSSSYRRNTSSRTRRGRSYHTRRNSGFYKNGTNNSRVNRRSQINNRRSSSNRSVRGTRNYSRRNTEGNNRTNSRRNRRSTRNNPHRSYTPNNRSTSSTRNRTSTRRYSNSRSNGTRSYSSPRSSSRSYSPRSNSSYRRRSS
ncbi:hypothetical protein R5O20_06200 [Tenacibaculum maritimum]|uniref:hypothetical protein n=1 Tax=Tenacibaculum maritimum TaxID=107401 RepID=UPI0012E641B0|nr:hypothetical protein [Tenacibaculum maritimum]CAA0214784.1 Probable lipoprotein precursor [Tenacibaculum maritimum]